MFDDFKGVGKVLPIDNSFLLVSQHPVTTEYGNGRWQIEQTLSALRELQMPTILLWPNIDAGSDDISKGIRTFREKYRPEWLHAFKNLPISIYIHLMKTTRCLIGNSSSGIREGAFIGTPVVNIGTRQAQRARGENIIDTGYNAEAILRGVRKQIDHGRYNSSDIYGNGTAGGRIADILAEVDPPVQKRICY